MSNNAHCWGARKTRLAVIASALVAATAPAQARVQEYQIIRLLSYKTSCQLAKLEDRSAPTGPMRFFARCENTTFYPDGIDVVCPDRDDDRSCTTATRAQTFDQLHLLVQPR